MDTITGNIRLAAVHMGSNTGIYVMHNWFIKQSLKEALILALWFSIAFENGLLRMLHRTFLHLLRFPMAFLTILEHNDVICIYTNNVTLKKEIRDYLTEFSGLVLEV